MVHQTTSRWGSSPLFGPGGPQSGFRWALYGASKNTVTDGRLFADFQAVATSGKDKVYLVLPMSDETESVREEEPPRGALKAFPWAATV
jgi:hypothetical protein